jgi:outer membrane protein TolC
MRDVHTPRRLASSCLGLAFVLAAATAGAEAPTTAMTVRGTTLTEAVAIALRQSPDVLARQAELEAARAEQAESRGQFGPKLHVDANVMQWNSPFDISLGAAVFRVREAFTWTVSPSIIQPITPLLTIYDQYKMQEYGVDVAAIRREVVRRDIAFQVVEGYYRLAEAERLAEVADASVTQLEAQQRQAQSLFDNGVIAKNDLLRAALAVANAQQRMIQVRGQIVLARGALDTLMGQPPDTPFEPVPFVGEPPPIGDATIQSVENLAAAQRLEVVEVIKDIARANEGVALAKHKLIPQVSAIGNYTHFEGSQFQQVDASYVGLFASWDVWDWGTTWNGIHKADARLDQVRIARKKLEDQVRLEARQAFVNASTARDALEVSNVAVSQAEENYRIVTKEFENNAATSFNVVDAESLLTQARGQVETSRYDYLIARAALQRAIGKLVDGDR